MAFHEPPHTGAYFFLYGEKWDFEYARNALLHFIEEKGLSDECKKWLEKHKDD
jgi:hypothetical protein